MNRNAAPHTAPSRTRPAKSLGLIVHLLQAAGTRHQLASAIRADVVHGGRAIDAERAFVATNERDTMICERGTAALALAPHLQAHRAVPALRSCSSKRSLRCSPPLNPPSVPSAAMTRWQGTTTGRTLRALALPTALAAPGRPSASATSPYDLVSPNGMRVNSIQTAFCHSEPANASGTSKVLRRPLTYSASSFRTPAVLISSVSTAYPSSSKSTSMTGP